MTFLEKIIESTDSKLTDKKYLGVYSHTNKEY